jgi:hypothetical protein
MQNMTLEPDQRSGPKAIPLERYLIIFDDILGDTQLKSMSSDLSAFTTMSRHFNVLNIFLCQNYTSIPASIRRNSNLIFLLACDTFSDIMITENSLKNKENELLDLYNSHVLEPKNYGVLCVDRTAKNSARYHTL